MSESVTNAVSSTPAAPKKKGCLFYGGVGCLGFLMLGVLMGVWTYYSVTSRFRPHDIQPVALNAQEEQRFEDKVQSLQRGKATTGMARGKASSFQGQNIATLPPITFSSKEITALVSGREFGNNAFKLVFEEGNIRVLANIPIPQELKNGLDGNMGPLDGFVGAFMANDVVPVSARVRLSLEGGRVYLQMLDADMMGFPLAALMGNTWQEWQRLDVLSAFGAQSSTLENLIAGLGTLKLDENGLHLGAF
jgi:hypothetical protein